MKTIDKNVINELIINKSRFITILYKLDNKEDVSDIITKYKGIYKGATHYCFAFVFDGTNKCSDDGEPSGTAGVPILNILTKHELNRVLCLVIRYFGGIKLGAGGLVRAYSNSARDAVKCASIIDLIPGYFISIEFEYDNIKIIDEVLRNITVTKKFDEKIVYEFKVEIDTYEKIENVLTKYSNIIKKESTLV